MSQEQKFFRGGKNILSLPSVAILPLQMKSAQDEKSWTLLWILCSQKPGVKCAYYKIYDVQRLLFNPY